MSPSGLFLRRVSRIRPAAWNFIGFFAYFSRFEISIRIGSFSQASLGFHPFLPRYLNPSSGRPITVSYTLLPVLLPKSVLPF